MVVVVASVRSGGVEMTEDFSQLHILLYQLLAILLWSCHSSETAAGFDSFWAQLLTALWVSSKLPNWSEAVAENISGHPGLKSCLTF